ADYYNYTITRTWHAEDPSGNFSECDQLITIEDVTVPAITCPTDITLNCDDDHSPTTAGSATATDNCAATVNITISYSDVSTQGSDPDNADYYNYTITRTWRAEDPSGNFSECEQLITIEDVTVPTVICNDITVYLDVTSGLLSLTPEMIDGGTFDNCSPVHLSVSRSNFDCTDLGENTVWLYAEDASGNIDSCQAVVNIQYTVVPVPVAVPADTIICNDSYTQIVLGNSFQNMSFRWTAGGSSDITGYSSDSLSLPFTISDSLHNSSNEVEVINYTITPFAYGLCQQPDITVPIYVNPTPRFTVEIADTIVCDSTTITLDVTDLLGNVQGDKVYDL
ncbi:MAG: hypothetical protein LC650_03710, partial [Actinobacteria bacterium]|nr:hypothetical protein [Actinomycetota bacterium]